MATITKKDTSSKEEIVENVLVSGIREIIKFKFQASEKWEWIEQNRVIYNSKWDWEYADIPVDVGIEDLKHLKLRDFKGKKFLEKAPRPYLRQYINDDTTIKSCIKCRRSEFTESEINTNLFYACTHDFFNIRHLFPTASVANRVAKEKINVAVKFSPTIFDKILKPFNITEKHFVSESWYTVDGAFTEFGGRGPDSDRIVFDEFNTHNPKIKEIYEASTDHSKYGQKIYISTPTFPNMGIDVEYKNGCQYTWFFYCSSKKCSHRNTPQEFIFPENIINFVEKGKGRDKEHEEELLKETYIGCRYCGKYVDKTSPHYVKTAKWFSKFPKREKIHASYSVTGFMLAWITGKALNSAYLRMRYINQFYNEKIGVSYIGDSSRVQKSDVEACQDHNFRNMLRKIEVAKNVSIGIDWGKNESWLVAIGDGLGSKNEINKKRVLFIYRIFKDTLIKKGFSDDSDQHVNLAIKVIDILGMDIIINDANGIGITANSKLYRKYKGKSYGSFYDTPETKKDKISRSSIKVKFSEDENGGIVIIPRTVELMESMDDFKNHNVTIPKIETNTGWLFVNHIHALASTNYHDEENDRIIQIVGHVGPDHFSHAYTLARVGYEKLKNEEKPKEAKKVTASKGK